MGRGIKEAISSHVEQMSGELLHAQYMIGEALRGPAGTVFAGFDRLSAAVGDVNESINRRSSPRRRAGIARYVGLFVALVAAGRVLAACDTPPEIPLPTGTPSAEAGEIDEVDADPTAQAGSTEGLPNLILNLPDTIETPTEKPASDISGGSVLAWLEAIGWDVAGTWTEDNGHSTYDFVGFQGGERLPASASADQISFDVESNQAFITTEDGTWVFSAGEWVSFDPDNQGDEIFMIIDADGRYRDWDGDNFELSIPYTNEQLDDLYGANHWRFSPSGDLELAKWSDGEWSESEWYTAIELADEGGINVRFFGEDELQHFEKDALSTTDVPGVGTRSVALIDTGEGPTGQRMLVPGLESFAIPMEVRVGSGGIENYVQIDYEFITSGAAEMSVLLQLPEFPEDAYPAQMAVRPLGGWTPGARLTHDPGPLTDPNAWGSDPQILPATAVMKHPRTGEFIGVAFPATKLASGSIFVAPVGFTDEYLSDPWRSADGQTQLEEFVFSPDSTSQLGIIVSTLSGKPGTVTNGPVWFPQPDLETVAGGMSSGSGWDAFPNPLTPDQEKRLISYMGTNDLGVPPEEIEAMANIVDESVLAPLTRRINIPTIENSRWAALE